MLPHFADIGIELLGCQPFTAYSVWTDFDDDDGSGLIAQVCESEEKAAAHAAKLAAGGEKARVVQIILNLRRDIHPGSPPGKL